jgi:hypothetical protein
MQSQHGPVALALTLAVIIPNANAHPTITQQQLSPCRAASNISAAALYALKQMWASNGADSAGIVLVTDSTRCQAVVSAYNTQSPSALHVDSGYVFAAGSKSILYIPPAQGTPYSTENVVIFNTAFQIEVRTAGVQ